ncbi:MAG: leucine-rich repeat domain-containing protein [Clostridia bacterium]|nr:leucine-rich repeat domain-containing protein [Clostridia bacterium]
MLASKRIFCVILCLIVLLSVPVFVCAEDDTSFTKGDFRFEILEDKTLCVTEYTGESTVVTIPSEIDGRSVSTVGDELFWYKGDITAVTLPENAEYIGARVFQNCTSLTEIKLPDTVLEIGDACFLGCSNLTKINIPANLVYAGAFAFDETPWVTQFDGCTSIILGGRVFYKYLADNDKVVIPDGIVCISDNAFDGKGLSFVKIPDSVAFIGDYAFYNCKNLKEIKLPSGIYHIGENSLGMVAGASEVQPLKDFMIYADEGTLGADYAKMYDVEIKGTGEFTEPESLPEAEVCVPTAQIRDADTSQNTVGLSQGAVIAIVLSIAGCVVIIGGITVVSHFYEKKRKKENKNIKKKKK